MVYIKLKGNGYIKTGFLKTLKFLNKQIKKITNKGPQVGKTQVTINFDLSDENSARFIQRELCNPFSESWTDISGYPCERKSMKFQLD